MTGRLFHWPASAVGTVTSGGTESILCAVAAYRDRARRERPWILRPELVVPTTIHPAFDKAAHWSLRRSSYRPDSLRRSSCRPDGLRYENGSSYRPDRYSNSVPRRRLRHTTTPTTATVMMPMPRAT